MSIEKAPFEVPPDGDAAAASTSRVRKLVFLAVVLICVLGAAGYAGFAAWRARSAAALSMQIPVTAIASLPPTPALTVSAPPPVTDAPAPNAPQAVLHSGAAASAPSLPPAADARPYLLFRSTALSDQYGRLSLEYLGADAGPRQSAPLQCERVHFAAGRGICLEARRGALTTYRAHVFDRAFKITHSVDLAGPPSRARMSPDGRLAAMTVFVSGHSYGSPDFTTRTSVLDAVSGQWLAEDLEKFTVTRDGAAFKATDFNFWGISFARDSRHFYATLGTAGKTLLIEGDVAARTARVINDNVECPSLSPDNRRIVFKRRIASGGAGRIVWQLQVLDLTSGKETPLTDETRNVDDQVEWLSDHEILYALPAEAPQSSASANIWVLSAEGSSPPRLLVRLASSPAVVR